MHRSLIGSLVLAAVTALAGCGGYESSSASTSAPAATLPDSTVTSDVVAGVKVNLNTASREAFLALPEVTEKMAHEFDEYRPYVSIQQFRQKIGKYVDDAQVARYERYVFVPINVNDCDAPTLQQIPGLDDAEAAALVAGRPYATTSAFIDALAGKVDASAMAIARGYITE